MNTNAGVDAPTFGQYCYDYADTRRSEVSSDYLALLGAYTFQGRTTAETAHFCGIFDGTNTMFPDVFSKSNVWWLLVLEPLKISGLPKISRSQVRDFLF